MPEGPTVRRWGEQIASCTGQVALLNRTTAKIAGIDRGALQKAFAHGKQLFLQLECDTDARPGTLDAFCKSPKARVWLRYHAHMDGRLTVTRTRPRENPQTTLQLAFSNTTYSWRLGRLRRAEAAEIAALKQSVDVLEPSFDREAAASFLRSSLPVGQLLLDQSHFAGLGNIVKNEALFAAKIAPQRLGSECTDEELMRVVEESLRFVRDWFAQRKQPKAQIYNCSNCPLQHPVERFYVAQRLCFSCDTCQK